MAVGFTLFRDSNKPAGTKSAGLLLLKKKWEKEDEEFMAETLRHRLLDLMEKTFHITNQLLQRAFLERRRYPGFFQKIIKTPFAAMLHEDEITVKSILIILLAFCQKAKGRSLRQSIVDKIER